MLQEVKAQHAGGLTKAKKGAQFAAKNFIFDKQ